MTVIQGILSKSELSGAMSTYPEKGRIANAPKSVKEWINMNDNMLTRTQTDANLTSSLMKRA